MTVGAMGVHESEMSNPVAQHVIIDERDALVSNIWCPWEMLQSQKKSLNGGSRSDRIGSRENLVKIVIIFEYLRRKKAKREKAGNGRF